MEKSMLDVAYEVVSGRENPIAFADLVKIIADKLSMSDDEVKRRISRFYTNLSLDGRFVTLGENVWDLRSRHTFDCVHIDMNDVYKDDEEDEEDKSEIELGLGEEGNPFEVADDSDESIKKDLE